MINVNELRIGNIIGSSYSPFSIITDIGKGKDKGKGYVSFQDFNRGYYLNDCSPIRLTEEILLKCGFDVQGNREYAEFNLIIGETKYEDIDGNTLCVNFHTTNEILVDFGVVLLVFGLKRNMDSASVLNNNMELETLHQLQNLCFALTGKELEVTI